MRLYSTRAAAAGRSRKPEMRPMRRAEDERAHSDVDERGARDETTPSDAELLLRTAERDADAFELLYRRYARSVYGLALRRLRDRDRAEEATQETFAAIWRSARSFRPERGTAGGWLYAVARHAIVDRFRKRGDPVALVGDEADPERGPAERAEAGWDAWRVHRAL